MPYDVDALAISDFLTAKFSGTNWDFVRQNLNAYMLSELFGFLDTKTFVKADFSSALKLKLLEQLKPPEIKNLSDIVNTFLKTYSIGII